jgi:hypothetical protein
MNASMKFLAAAAFACGLATLAPQPVQAMPVATSGVDAGAVTEQAHAVRMCNRFGRCWWTYAGHWHRRFYGYHRPVYRYGWRHPYYGRHWGYRHYGWRRHWR